MTCHANSVLPEIRAFHPQDTPLANIAEINARGSRGLEKDPSQRIDSPSRSRPAQPPILTILVDVEAGVRNIRTQKRIPGCHTGIPPNQTDALGESVIIIIH